MTAQQPPIFLENESHPSEDVRRFVGSLARGGIVTPGDLVVSQNGTPNMSVNVAGGRAFIPGSGTYQGTYMVENRGTRNVTIATADGTNPRNDLIVARVRDSFYSGADDDWDIVAVTGTPAAVPVDPTPPDNSITLAKVAVAAGATSITTGNITDRRTRAVSHLPVSPPSVMAKETADSSISNNTITPVNFTVADLWDTDAFHDTAVNPSRLTVPAGLGGLYLVTAVINWDTNTTGSRQVLLRKNGSSYLSADYATPNTTAVRQVVSDQVRLSAGDYIECTVRQDSGATRTIYGSVVDGLRFGMTFLGPV